MLNLSGKSKIQKVATIVCFSIFRILVHFSWIYSIRCKSCCGSNKFLRISNLFYSLLCYLITLIWEFLIHVHFIKFMVAKFESLFKEAYQIKVYFVICMVTHLRGLFDMHGKFLFRHEWMLLLQQRVNMKVKF